MENFFTAAKPFLTFAKLFGYFPMSFIKNPKSGELKVKWFDVVISSFWVLFILAMNVKNFSGSGIILSTSSMLIKAWNVFRTVELVLYVGLVFDQIYKRQNILRFLRVIHDFDEHVSCFE